MGYGIGEERLAVASQSSFNTFLEAGLTVFFLTALLIFIFIVVFGVIRRLAKNNHYYDHTIFLVRLPKDSPGDTQKEETVQQLREDIAKAESIFASIGGLRAQRGLKPFFFGRTDHFSFEIVASKKKIAFYIVTPQKMAEYMEKQIHAYFPDAAIEAMDDYNIFLPNGIIKAGCLKTKRHFIFPIKTYQKQDIDPMNSIINTMSKLDADESMAIQFIVRSAKNNWHRKAAQVRRGIHKGMTLKNALKGVSSGPVMGAIRELIEIAKPPTKNQQDFNQQQQMRMTSMEEECLKGIEEKNSKAGLDVNLRIIVSTENTGKAQLLFDNIGSAFGQYNLYEYGNSFHNKIAVKNSRKIIKDFIYRKFSRKLTFLLNAEELVSLYHLPLKSAETPNILWLTAKHAPAPNNIPNEGIKLGDNVYRGVVKEIRIKRADRRRHMYLIGKSGGCKSKFIAGMANQDIINGEGVCVLDPHGDLIEDILVRIPPERAEDVILFSPSDFERPMALNLLEFDPRYPEQKTFVINELIKIFDKLYDLKSTGGPIFEQYMRNALLLIMSDPDSGSTLMEIPKVLADADFRKMKLERCKDSTVVDFWRQEAEKAGGDAALANVVPYITSKLTQFISNDTMRPIIGQQKSSFNVRDIMDKQKILLIDLSKGTIGEMNAFLLGLVIIGQILQAALSRADINEEQRKDFYLYIDEFQNFTTDSINSILSEARKYGLNLIIAHQYLGQLVKNGDTSIRDAVFGNVGTWALLRIGTDDAEIMEKEFSPVFNQYDLLNVDKFSAYMKLLIENAASRPFSMKMPWPLPGIKNEHMAKKIKTLSRLKYGQDRNMIEAEIRRRTKI
ncbi:type IV secretion system DNA-binding domain-containing protein [bacterium]|nr:type IV secretion system DNA-binding domain-containing protein [bacterium]